MKKIVLLVFWSFLALCGSVNCQVFTKEIQIMGDSSVIRRITTDKWMVYSNYKGTTRFYAVSASGATANYLQISVKDTHIYDFQIIKDTVFFCGYVNVNGTTQALLGYFPLAGFPNVTVKCKTFDYLKSFRKMAVFTAGEQIHVVMTSTKSINNAGTMVDARRVAGNSWEVNTVDNMLVTETFDDVIVTSKHIIFSSRYFRLIPQDAPGYDFTRIWFIDRPVYAGTSIFSTSIFTRSIQSPSPTDAVLLENIGNDCFISVNPIAGNYLLASRFGGTYYDASAQFHADGTTQLKDLENNQLYDTHEVLVNTQTSTRRGSYIYHLKESMFDQGGAYYRHYYDNDFIHSLCWDNTPDYLFAASGMNLGNLQQRFYRYCVTNWGCAQRESFSSERVVLECPDRKIDIKVIIDHPNFEPINTYHNYELVNTICE